MTESHPPLPSRRLRGWKLTVVIGSTVLLVLIGLLALPFIVADSYERVVDQARLEGIPGSARELGRRGDPGRARLTREIDVLMRGIQLYQPYARTTRFGESPHPELARLYRAVPPAVRDRAVELARSVRGAAWETRPEPFARGNDEYALNKLARLLCDRWLVEVTSEADEEAALLLLDSAEACDPVFGQASRAAYQAMLALKSRLAGIHDRVALALRLRQLADRQWPDLVRDTEASFALNADFLRDPWRGAKDHGLALPRILEWPLTMRGLCRLGGARYLGYELDCIRLVRSGSDPLVVRTGLDRLVPSGMSAATLLSKLLFGRHASGKVTQTARTALLARALAWHLDGQQRPLDDFDPRKAPVRTIERDGRVLAIYSVGNDGHDNGGDDKADLVWWLEPDPALPGP